MLDGIARDELPDGDAREFLVRIRDGGGVVLLIASLVLRVDSSVVHSSASSSV
jgi:hypothetical protein